MTSASNSSPPNADAAPSFLPDFCNARVILRMIVMSEVLAFILALGAYGAGTNLWEGLGMTTLFVQWVVLGNVLLLCLGRSWLQQMPAPAAAMVCYVMSLLVTLLVSYAALWLIPAGSESMGWQDLIPNRFVLRNLAISAIVSAVALRYFHAQYQWKSNIETEARSRIQALQARIRPHFLFNSMNTIASLTRTNPERAEQAVEDLADLFRASLGQREKVALDEELEFARRYINIEQLRLGERLNVECTVAPEVPRDCKVPALVLQPLVENAIYHGIEPQTEGGTVSIAISRQNDMIEFNIINPVPTTLSNYRRSGNQMAQENIRQRLRLAYGAQSDLRIRKDDKQYSVSFTLPVESDT